MKALSIQAESVNVNELEIEMQANTIYSFFSSILIDELSTINHHIIYADANALSEKKKAYFLGEQLIVGDALIIGKVEFQDQDVSINKEEVESLIKIDVNQFYMNVLSLLSSTDINLYRTFEVKKSDEVILLNTEWVLYTFNIADVATQNYFISELTKSIKNSDNTEDFIAKMAGLAMNAVR